MFLKFFEAFRGRLCNFKVIYLNIYLGDLRWILHNILIYLVYLYFIIKAED